MKTLIKEFNRVLTTLLSIAALMVGQTAWADDDSGNCGTKVSYTYVESTQTLTISGTGDMADYNSSGSNQPWKNYKSNITTIIIEDGVTTIGKYAFDGCEELTAVTIPNSIATIGDYAFNGCSELESVIIPGSKKTKIGQEAFCDCTGMVLVIIGKGVTYIDEDAFYGCTSVKDVYCYADPSNLNWYESSNDFRYDDSGTYDKTICHVKNASDWSSFVNVNVLFEGDLMDLTSGDCGATGHESDVQWSCNLSTQTLTISGTGDMADFDDSDNQLWKDYLDYIKDVVISDEITHIGDYAFYNCSKLESIIIPAKVTSIGDYAFYNCSTLESIIIPTNVTTIGNYVFYNCSKLESIIIPDKVTSIGDYAFYNCSKLESIIIPANVTSIGAHAFENSTLQKVYCLNKTAPVLGSNAFDNCTSLSAIVKPAASDYSSWSAYSNKLKPGYIVKCGDGITATSDGPLVQKNETVTLEYTNVVSSGYTVIYTVKKDSDGSDITANVLSGTTLTMPDDDVTVTATTYKTAYITHWQAGPYHDGSNADKPYVITTSAGLDLLASEVNGSTDFSAKFFVLDNDISYGPSGSSNYTPIGTKAKPYKCTLDGRGHAISGIIIYNTGITCQGLFGYVDGGTVENVTVANSQIGGNDSIACIVGYCASGTISNCFAYNTTVLLATGDNCGDKCGIIIGNNNNDITLTDNYYRECTVQKGGTNYTTNIGYNDDANTLTDKEGAAEPVYTLTAGTGVSVIGEATVTYDSKGFYAHNAPATIKDNFESYMAPDNNLIYYIVKNESGTPDVSGYGLADGWTFPMPAADIVAKIEYIDNQALALFDDDSDRPTGKKNTDYIFKGGSNKKVILQNRIFYKGGTWNTLCLPFNVVDGDGTDALSFTGTPLEGTTVMELDTEGTYDTYKKTGFDDASGTLYLYFKDATSIEAGKPYIVKWTTTGDPIQNPMFTDVTINSTIHNITSDDGKVSFKGTYSPVKFTEDNQSILFLGYDSEDTEHHSKLYYPQTGVNIGACRAYFELNGIIAGNLSTKVKEFQLYFGGSDEVAADAINLTPALSEGKGAIYNLAGQRLQKMQKGINIVNGKKILK